MLIGLYMDRTLKSWCGVHPRSQGKVNNIFHVPLTMLNYSFAGFKSEGTLRNRLSSIHVHPWIVPEIDPFTSPAHCWYLRSFPFLVVCFPYLTPAGFYAHESARPIKSGCSQSAHNTILVRSCNKKKKPQDIKFIMCKWGKGRIVPDKVPPQSFLSAVE